MRPEHQAQWDEFGAIFAKQKALHEAEKLLSPELFHELTEYWKGVAPGQVFDPREAVALLYQNVKRYEAALQRIVERPQDQKRLIEHRESTGQEVTEGDRQRWYAYLDVAHLAAEALGLSGHALLGTNPDSGEPRS